MNLLREKMRLLPMSGPQMDGGGGGGGNQTSSTTQTTELPEWARGYAKDVLATGQALTNVDKNPYKTYDQPRIAGFSGLQQQAQTGAAMLAPSAQTGTASNLAAAAGLGALNMPQYQAGRFSGGMFTPGAAQAYMNPYVQASLDPQMALLQRQQGQQAAQMAGQATQAGAFGGSRFGLAQAQQNLNNQLSMQNLVGQGYNTAFQQAQQQFNQDMARRMQAQQLGEQSRQFGANLGLQGLQTGLQAAGTLGNLGQQQFAQQQGAIDAQSKLGAQEQAQRQKGLDISYQDFLNQQNYPYKQLGFMSDLIRGLPLGQQSTAQIYQSPGSMMGQMAGLGLGAFGLSQMGLRFAEGGSVDGYADGGSVTDKFHDPEAMMAEMDKLSDQQLQQILQSPVTPAEAQAAQQELAQRASERRGMSAAFNQLPADNQQNMIRAAGGGILAFSKGGDEGEYQPTSSYWEQMGNVLGLIPRGIKTLVSAPGYGLSSTNESRKSAAPEAAPETDTVPYNVMTATRRADYEPKAAPKKDKAAAHPAVQQARGIAEAAGDVGTFDSNFQKYMKELSGASTEQLKEIKGLLAKQMGEGEDIKKEGLGRALASFGFNMAAQAAQPGVARRSGLAGLLQSAGAASPALYESVSETNRLARAAKDNALKMQVEMMKYETALKKGDQQTAAMLANNIEQRQFQQAQLAEQKRKNDMWASVMQARAGGNNRMEVEMFKAQGRAQTEATRHVQNIVKEWGNRLPKEWKDKGYTSVEQVRPILERHYTGKFLPGALSAVSESRARDISDNDVIDLAGD